VVEVFNDGGYMNVESITEDGVYLVEGANGESMALSVKSANGQDTPEYDDDIINCGGFLIGYAKSTRNK
jgi:hypothetical protein